MLNEDQSKVEEHNESVEECVNEEKNSKNPEEELENQESEEDASKLVEILVDGLKNENTKLLEENNKVNSENQVLKDRLARTVAEYDNFRKRTSKEKEGIYTDACEDILKEILPVFDNIERAVTVGGSLEDLKKGIEITIKQFNTALEKLNVEEIKADAEFDPNVHNAVMHVDDEQIGENQVVEVFEKGYKRGDKVLRYSMVKVAN